MEGMTIGQPIRGDSSDQSISSTSPLNNDENLIQSPISFDLFSAYEDALKPETVEGLMQVFYHKIYPLYVIPRMAPSSTPF